MIRRCEVRTVSGAVLVLAAFLACAVEMVEATTIVLAVGVTRGWHSPLLGAGAATLALVVVIGALGPALVQLPIDALRIVVGGLLLTFGLQWLRKAILRAGGYKALHDEDAIFREEVALVEQEGAAACRRRWTGMGSRSRSRACSSKGWRWRSSC